MWSKRQSLRGEGVKAQDSGVKTEAVLAAQATGYSLGYSECGLQAAEAHLWPLHTPHPWAGADTAAKGHLEHKGGG